MYYNKYLNSYVSLYLKGKSPFLTIQLLPKFDFGH